MQISSNMIFTSIAVLLAVFFVRFASSAVAAPNYKVVTDEDADPYKTFPDPEIDAKETSIKYWRENAYKTLNEKVNKKINTNVAKNVIFFMGDGMSIPTITAARIYQGQNNKQHGEENQLFFETFPFSGLSKTYCVDKQVPDSASTATAYLRGVKSNYYTIGVTAKVKPADCESAKLPSNRPSSIVKWAQDAGKATGIVTNTRITDASPAGAYAHVPLRDMEDDADVVELGLDPNSCNFDIAQQLIHGPVGRNIKVIMGGGRDKFLPNATTSPNGRGHRLQGDLIEAWKQDKIAKKASHVYLTNAEDLAKLKENVTGADYILGLFAPSHLAYNLQRPKDQPTLSEMVETAIKSLSNDKNGFFLFVEGGLIDKAHHKDMARKALAETVEFANAIELATKLTSEEDTLIVVTADHAHTMSISGYPARGHDILGIYGKSQNGMPYSTLSYANGLGYKKEYNLEKEDMKSIDYMYPALVLKEWESHGGDDVAVFARGPWAHIFSGTYEQSFIPIAEAHAANIPIPDETAIVDPPQPPAPPQDQTTSAPDHPAPKPEQHSSAPTSYAINKWTVLLLSTLVSLPFISRYSLSST